MTRVIIVGGGITGLVAAWELQQQGIDYTLLEASNRLGGKIITERTDGFIIEAGADSFLAQKPWAWQLCHEIGLDLIGTNDAHRSVYVLRGGKLHLMPRGMRLIVPLDAAGLLESSLLSDAGKRRMLDEVHIPPRENASDTDDESLASFVERRFGPEALEVFGESLLAGIHVADPRKLSMAAAFPQYLQYERTHGSVIRGTQNATPPTPDPAAPNTAFVSPRNGMIELVETLQSRLTGDVRIGQAVSRIDSDRSVILSNGDRLPADVLIVTVPAHAASRMIQPIVPALAGKLSAITALSSGTVSLGFRRDQVDHPLDGFGFVIPHSESTHIRACTWSSTKLAGRAPDGYVLIRVFIGGFGHEQDVNLPDDQQIALARDALQQIMGIHAEPAISRVFRWREANPQYEVGHLQRVAEMKALSPPWLYLTGCTYNGVGIPDCVRQGRETAQKVIEYLREPEKRP